MLQNIRRKYFEILWNAQSQNTFLKGLLLLTIIINIILLITAISLASKNTLLISKNSIGQSTLVNPQAIPKNFIKKEIINAITRFIILRHNWNHKNISEQLTKSSIFIAPNFKSLFIQSNNPQVVMAKKKK